MKLAAECQYTVKSLEDFLNGGGFMQREGEAILNNRVLLGLAIFATSCDKPGTSLRSVTATEYRHQDCWFRGDNLETFVVFGRYGTQLIPYAISSKCFVTQGFENSGVAMLSLMGTLNIEGPPYDFHGRLIAGNTASDLPAPEGSTRVYYMVARVNKSQTSATHVKITDIQSLTDVGLTFEQLLSLPKDSVERLAIHAKR